MLWRGASSVPLDGSKQRGRESPFMRYNFKLFVAMLFALIPGIVSAGIRMSSRPRCPVRATLPANSRLPSATRTQAGTITQTGGKSSLSKERCSGPASSTTPMCKSNPLRGRWPAFAFPRQQNRSASVPETRSMVMVARRSSWTFHSDLWTPGIGGLSE